MRIDVVGTECYLAVGGEEPLNISTHAIPTPSALSLGSAVLCLLPPVAKYFQVNELVGQRMQAQGQALQAQQAGATQEKKSGWFS